MIAWDENGRTGRTSTGPNRSTRRKVAPEQWLLDEVTDRFGEDLSSRILSLWGLPASGNGTAPGALWDSRVLHSLLERGAKLKVHGPRRSGTSDRRFHPQVTLCDADYQCLIGADALLVHGERELYRRPDFYRMMVLLQSPIIFDNRGLYPPERLLELGFEYHYPNGGGGEDGIRQGSSRATRIS